MIVCHEYDVNRWQILKCESRIAHPSRADAAEWARTLLIDRIGQHIESAKLDQKGDVIDERERNLAGSEARGQRGLCAIHHPLGPRCARRGQPPTQ